MSRADAQLVNVSAETRRELRDRHALGGGRLQDAIAIVRDWIHKQPHIAKKDLADDDLMEFILIICKGSVERAKVRIDNYCTIRTMMPEFFEETNAKEFAESLNLFKLVAYPQLTKDYVKICISKTYQYPASYELIENFIKYCLMVIEYCKHHDLIDGIVVIVDFLEENTLSNIIPHVTPGLINKINTFGMKCYGLRVKGIHILSASKLVDILVKLLKQVFSKKLGERIYVHKSVEELHQFIDKDLLPSDYGGKQKSIQDMSKAWVQALCSEDHVNYLKRMKDARTDETLRAVSEFNDQYLGMAGSFRTLSVD